MPRRSVVWVLAALLGVACVSGCTSQPRAVAADTPTGAERPDGEGEGRGGNAEAEEQQQETAERLEALRDARDAGTFGARVAPTAFTPAQGWAGEAVLNPKRDDWEPAIAADPREPYVYVVATRYATKPCKGNCPSPWMALAISRDGGKTWGKQRPLCACKGPGQFDPMIEVAPATGAVYAAYMNGYNVMFIRSTDHGRTWTAPVKTFGNVAWNDKPVLAVSDDGTDVYISWNGPKGGDPWVAQSHDAGRTWTQTKLANGDHYFYAFDGDVTSDGRVLFAESAVDYANNIELTGTTELQVFVSDDRGATWSNVIVDRYPPGIDCADCRADFYSGHTALSADGRGNVVIAYDAPTEDHGLQRIYARRSGDGGMTWSGRTALSLDGEHATAPMMESRGDGDVRVAYFQTAGGGNLDRWSVWYRSSTDGGRTWTSAVKISDRTNGAAYKSAAGFGEVYGDYGEIGIASNGSAIAAWGEGPSYVGPGGTWINRQT